jgi:hypothetical protein
VRCSAFFKACLPENHMLIMSNERGQDDKRFGKRVRFDQVGTLGDTL